MPRNFPLVPSKIVAAWPIYILKKITLREGASPSTPAFPTSIRVSAPREPPEASSLRLTGACALSLFLAGFHGLVLRENNSYLRTQRNPLPS